MEGPEISIVIPCFSKNLELSEAIESILAQSYQDFEIILVDNNSKEECRAIAQSFARRYPEKIRMIHEPVQGVCSARNTGILQSRGRLIATHDEDDLMKPNRLEAQRDLLIKRSDLSLVTSKYDLISPDGLTILKENISYPTVNTEKSFRIIEKAVISLFQSLVNDDYAQSFHFHVPSAFMFKKETALKAGLFDIRFNPQFLEDYEFQIRMFAEGPFAQVPESLFFYRESPWKYNKKSFSKAPEKYQVHPNWHQNEQVFFASLWEKFSQISPNNIPVLKRIRAVILRTVGLHALTYQDGEAIGSELLRRSFCANPSDTYTFKLYLKTFFPRSYYPRLFWFDNFETGSLEKIPKDFSRTFLKWPPRYPEHLQKDTVHGRRTSPEDGSSPRE